MVEDQVHLGRYRPFFFLLLFIFPLFIFILPKNYTFLCSCHLPCPYIINTIDKLFLLNENPEEEAEEYIT